jgi:hypothetical protein
MTTITKMMMTNTPMMAPMRPLFIDCSRRDQRGLA